MGLWKQSLKMPKAHGLSSLCNVCQFLIGFRWGSKCAPQVTLKRTSKISRPAKRCPNVWPVWLNAHFTNIVTTPHPMYLYIYVNLYLRCYVFIYIYIIKLYQFPPIRKSSRLDTSNGSSHFTCFTWWRWRRSRNAGKSKSSNFEKPWSPVVARDATWGLGRFWKTKHPFGGPKKWHITEWEERLEEWVDKKLDREVLWFGNLWIILTPQIPPSSLPYPITYHL